MKKRGIVSATHKATRQIALHFEQKAKGSRLTPQEGHLLTYLRSYAPCTVGELVRVFGVKASTMTSILDRLEKEGCVERTLNPDDRRSFVVDLTSHGREKGASIQKFVEKTDEQIARRVSKRDLDGFFKVMQAIDEATGIAVRPKKK